jgi:hypothetical protein
MGYWIRTCKQRSDGAYEGGFAGEIRPFDGYEDAPACALRILRGCPSLGRGLAQGVTLRRRDVRFEEALLLRTGAAHGLGVPLDAEQPALG